MWRRQLPQPENSEKLSICNTGRLSTKSEEGVEGGIDTIIAREMQRLSKIAYISATI